MSFTLPPLRARRSEIRPLCQVFATRACVEHDRTRELVISDAAYAALERHDWPGNVRELKNVIERAVVLCSGPQLDVEHLPAELSQPSQPRPSGLYASTDTDAAARLRQEMADLERERVLKALEECGGNQSLAAERLGVSRRTLVYRLSAFGLTRSRKRS